MQQNPFDATVIVQVINMGTWNLIDARWPINPTIYAWKLLHNCCVWVSKSSLCLQCGSIQQNRERLGGYLHLFLHCYILLLLIKAKSACTTILYLIAVFVLHNVLFLNEKIIMLHGYKSLTNIVRIIVRMLNKSPLKHTAVCHQSQTYNSVVDMH